jgi:hypothetical protein
MFINFRLGLLIVEFTAFVLVAFVVMLAAAQLLDFLADADCEASLEAFDRVTKRVLVFTQTEQVIVVTRNEPGLKIDLWRLFE